MSDLSTIHRLISGDSRNMDFLEDNSIDLVVTSPPYPMISMWDNAFCQMNSKIPSDFGKLSGQKLYDLMHEELMKVWKELCRVLKPGGFICINIGDATRSIDGNFALYPNHSRIIESCLRLGLENLPNIIWKKPTNAPNKFMGSGTLPSGAYVTLEHEYILIFRKGGKRAFDQHHKRLRQQSAFFWEERNVWFSDSWLIKGAMQKMPSASRERSAAFPLEIPYRLINMYSLYGDTILDPFNGTGNTSSAAIISGRNSIGVEIDSHLNQKYIRSLAPSINDLKNYVNTRLDRHKEFIKSNKGSFKYKNEYYGFPVKSKQEIQICLPEILEVRTSSDDSITVQYK